MARIPAELRYSADHEWAGVDPEDADVVIVGISDYAQSQLGDVVMVELPEVGDTAEAGEPFGVVESPKSVSDVYAPVDGEIVEINEALEDQPELVNEDCYGAGWLIKIRATDLSQLDDMKDAAAYKTYVQAAEQA